MIANLLPNEATQSSLDLSEKLAILGDFRLSFVKNWDLFIVLMDPC